MQCIDIVRRYGSHGITRVLVSKASGKEYMFAVGRHVSVKRIYELANSLKLRELYTNEKDAATRKETSKTEK